MTMEGLKGRLNLFIIILETVALLFIAGSITIYYLYILPKSNQEQLAFEQMKWQQDQKAKQAQTDAKNEQAHKLQECLKKADQDLENKKRYTCTTILGMKPDCEPLGHGSYGTALYDALNKQRDACQKTYPAL